MTTIYVHFHFLIILTNGHLVQYFYVLFARCSLNVPALGRGRVKACYLLCLLTKHPSPSELYSISMGPRLSRQRGGGAKAGHYLCSPIKHSFGP